MTDEYDFEMVKRAYAEMARRAQEKDEVRRMARYAQPQQNANTPAREALDEDAQPA